MIVIQDKLHKYQFCATERNVQEQKQRKNKINTDATATKQIKKNRLKNKEKQYLGTPSSAESVIRVRCTVRTFSSTR
jgi:hypothetical protein